MKKFKKLSVVALLSAGAVLATACSQGTNDNKSQTSVQSGQKEDTSAAGVLNAAIENLYKEKSYEIHTLKNINFTGSANGQTVKKDIQEKNTQLVLNEQNLSKFTREVDQQKLEVYSNATEQYALSFAGNWAKSKFPKTREKIVPLDLANLNSIVKYNKDLTITEDNKSYTISFKPANLKEWISTKYPDATDSNFEKYEVSVKIDKESKRLISIEHAVKGSYQHKNLPQPLNDDYVLKSEFKNYGNVAAFSIPEEAKNAQEITINLPKE